MHRSLSHDEVTANVDPDNKAKLQQAMEDPTRKKTIRNADHILKLNNGQIVESDKHEELIAQQGLNNDLVSARSRAIRQKITKHIDKKNF